MLNILKQLTNTKKRIILSAIIGNMLENFDVMICAFFAQKIAVTFFPSNSVQNNIINTFCIFLISYLSRPIGSLLIGLYSDQIGRKKILIFSIIMVGVCTAAIGIIPSYQVIGISSTFLFSFFRALQNFSAGGEYISSVSYLIENVKKEERGFYGCWVSVGFNLGTFFASILVFLMLYFINTNVLPDWSWRIIFVLSLLGISMGPWIRRSLPESMEFILENSNTLSNKKTNILFSSIKLIKNHPLRCLSLIAITWLGVGETSAIFVYSPIHMTMINNFSQHQALGMNTLSLLFLIPMIPIFGLLSDRYNKLKMLMHSTLTFLILSIPYFILLSTGTYTQILFIKLLFCIPSACYYAIAPVFITECFPTRLRCTSLALLYQTTLSIAAGITPLAMIYLMNFSKYHSHLPAYYLIISCLIGLIGLFYLASKNTTTSELDSNFFSTESS